jgi:hypothetical protein
MSKYNMRDAGKLNACPKIVCIMSKKADFLDVRSGKYSENLTIREFLQLSN